MMQLNSQLNQNQVRFLEKELHMYGLRLDMYGSKNFLI